MEPSFGLSLLLEGSVAPSEISDKVQRAIENVIGDCAHSVERRGDRILVSCDGPKCLRVVHDQLRDRHVRAAARRLLQLNRQGSSSTLMLNRQAATRGVVVLCSSEEESPLGPIYATIRSGDLDSVIGWLTDYPAG